MDNCWNNYNITTRPVEQHRNFFPISIFIVLANFAGNTLTIIVIAKTKSLHKFCNFLLINLALSDISVGLLEMIGMSYCSFTSRQASYESCIEAVFPTVGLLVFPLLQVSLLTIITIAIDRYLAVAKPFQVMQRGRVGYLKIIIPCLWAMGFVLASPILIAFTGFGDSGFQGRADKLQIMGIVFAASSYLFPTAVLIGTYVRIVRILKHRENQVVSSSQAGVTLRTQKRASKLLGAVIVAHNFCFFPYAFVTFVATQPFACKIIIIGGLTAYYITYYLQLLSTANNSFIYFFHSKVFRDACKAVFMRRKRF